MIGQLGIRDEILDHRILLRIKTDERFANTRPNRIILIGRECERGKNRNNGNGDHQFNEGKPFFRIHFHLPKMISLTPSWCFSRHI